MHKLAKFLRLKYGRSSYETKFATSGTGLTRSRGDYRHLEIKTFNTQISLRQAQNVKRRSSKVDKRV